MRIAMIGLRGLPATYGGVERHVEELGSRLVARGHEVTVFCRSHYVDPRVTEHRGIRLVHVPSTTRMGVEALLHSALSSFTMLRGSYDIAHYHALGPGLCMPIARQLSGAAVVLTVHGRDDRRAKWGRFGKAVLNTGRRMSARVPDELVVVSRALQRYYTDRYARTSSYVTNGAPQVPAELPELPAELGLTPGGYLLFVGRLVPEKDPELLIRAWRQLDTPLRLAVVGASSHTDEYAERLRELAAEDDRVSLLGYQFGDTLGAIYHHARGFVQPSLLEGLPITLLEAAAHGLPVVASDIPPHVEVVESSGPGHWLFPAGDLAALTRTLTACLDDPAAAQDGAAELRSSVLRRYDWDVAADQLEEAYERALRRRRTRVVDASGGAADPAPAGQR